MIFTYLGQVLILNILPIVDQVHANSITTMPYYQDCIDQRKQNRQHFPLMLSVPRLKIQFKIRFLSYYVKQTFPVYIKHKLIFNPKIFQNKLRNENKKLITKLKSQQKKNMTKHKMLKHTRLQFICRCCVM